MFIYSLKKRFDPNSGEEVDPIMKPCGKICDYTGRLIDPDNDEEKPLYATTLNYDNGCEEAWYYDDERQKLEDEMGVDYQDFAQFIEGPYHFGTSYEGRGFSDNSVLLVNEWVESLKVETEKSTSPFFKCYTLDSAFRAARYRTLFNLLKEGKYTLADFGMPTTERK